MGIKEIKPTTPGRRGMFVTDFSLLSKKKREKSLTLKLKKRAGRNAQGRITVRHQGGGAKRLYRMIDFKQDKFNIPGKIAAIEYDPNRTAFIALVHYRDGEKRYILAPQKIKVGSEIMTTEKGEAKIGNRLKLKNIPLGSFVYNIELTPGKGGQLVRSAGTAAQIMGSEDKYTILKMPSGEVRKVLSECYASIGVVSNPEHELVKIGKAGRSRWMNKRPQVRGKAMNPKDHPHGGGEGSTDIGLIHPKTPWGAPALGYKTRRPKSSDKLILKKRKK